MFHGDRWAAAFIKVSKDAETGLICLRAMTPPLKAVSRVLFGRFAAARLERILRECVAAAEDADAATAEYAIRFICLLVEKNYFKYIDSVLEKIEERIDKQKGVLEVIAESAVPLDGTFEDELRQQLAGAGVSQLKIKTRLVPDLIGGYRLLIGGFCIDASLRGQLKKMTNDLEAAALAYKAPDGEV